MLEIDIFFHQACIFSSNTVVYVSQKDFNGAGDIHVWVPICIDRCQEVTGTMMVVAVISYRIRRVVLTSKTS